MRNDVENMRALRYESSMENEPSEEETESSDCCNAPVRVVGSPHYYICMACDRPCDLEIAQ